MLINIKLNKDLTAELKEKSDDGVVNHFRGENLISFGNCGVWDLKGNFFSESGFSTFYGDDKFNLKNIWLINHYDNSVINMKQVSSHQMDKNDDEYEVTFCRDHNSATIQDEISLLCKYDSKRGNYRVAICDKRKSFGFASMDNWSIRFEFEMKSSNEEDTVNINSNKSDEESNTDMEELADKCGCEINTDKAL